MDQLVPDEMVESLNQRGDNFLRTRDHVRMLRLISLIIIEKSGHA